MDSDAPRERTEACKTFRGSYLRLDKGVDERLARDGDPSFDTIEGAADRLLRGLEHISDLGHRELLGVVQLQHQTFRWRERSRDHPDKWGFSFEHFCLPGT